MRKSRWGIATWWLLAVQACVISPENDNGLQTKGESFSLLIYAPGEPPFDLNIEQQSTWGTWYPTRSVTAELAEDLPTITLSDGDWKPVRATTDLSSSSVFWANHPTYGGIHQSLMRVTTTAGDVLAAPEDIIESLDCIAGRESGVDMALTCAYATEGVITMNTCDIADGYINCGGAGYPTALHREVISRLSGKQPIDDPELGSYTLAGRSTDEQKAVARRYIEAKLDGPQTVTLIDDYSSGANVLALIPANTSTSGVKELVVVGAHFDSRSPYVPGALDNASGVAMVIDAARHVRQMPTRKRDVLFVAFDDEETGRLGSAHMAETLGEWEADGDYDVHSVHLVDEIGDSGPEIMIEAPTGYAGQTDCLWDMYNDSNNLGQFDIPLSRYTSTSNTDHIEFLRKGFKAINVTETVGGVTGYHRDCIGGQACSSSCGGDCESGQLCEEWYCEQEPSACTCDVYENMDRNYLAAASILFRYNLERTVAPYTNYCND